MHTQVTKTNAPMSENAVVKSAAHYQGGGSAPYGFMDNRPAAKSQMDLQRKVNASHKVVSQRRVMNQIHAVGVQRKTDHGPSVLQFYKPSGTDTSRPVIQRNEDRQGYFRKDPMMGSRQALHTIALDVFLHVLKEKDPVYKYFIEDEKNTVVFTTFDLTEQPVKLHSDVPSMVEGKKVVDIGHAAGYAATEIGADQENYIHTRHSNPLKAKKWKEINDLKTAYSRITILIRDDLNMKTGGPYHTNWLMTVLQTLTHEWCLHARNFAKFFLEAREAEDNEEFLEQHDRYSFDADVEHGSIAQWAKPQMAMRIISEQIKNYLLTQGYNEEEVGILDTRNIEDVKRQTQKKWQVLPDPETQGDWTLTDYPPQTGEDQTVEYEYTSLEAFMKILTDSTGKNADSETVLKIIQKTTPEILETAWKDSSFSGLKQTLESDFGDAYTEWWFSSGD